MMRLTKSMSRLWVLSVVVPMSGLGSTHSYALGEHSEHAARGVVITVHSDRREIEISCDEVPGYMAAMDMPFSVRDGKSLDTVKPGMAIRFKIVTRGKLTYAEDIHSAATQIFESEPMEAGSLTALNSIMDAEAVQREVAIGARVPDFALVDQAEKPVHLSQFEGKVVALTFGYSRCPNPNYCYRLSNNLERVERRFHDRGGRDLVLLTIAIDPDHDQGQVLREYANSFHANVADWHFLTGSLADVKQVGELFGLHFWNSEGFLTHSLHTVIIDRKGRLVTNLEGNQFTSKQLGDLVQVELNRR